MNSYERILCHQNIFMTCPRLLAKITLQKQDLHESQIIQIIFQTTVAMPEWASYPLLCI